MTGKRRGSPPAAPAPRLSWWAPTLLVSATAIVYANSLSLPFVFDDRLSIEDNDTIRSLWPIARALWAPAQSAPAGRPAVNLSLALNYALGGLSPWGYHLWNLVVHLLAGLLLFGCVRRTLLMGDAPRHVEAATGRAPSERRTTTVAQTTDLDVRATWLAAACALLWLLHPLQSEVVDYVSQRTESMMGLAYLATLYAAIRATTADRLGRWQVAAVAACAAGMACKESMATAPIAVLLYDVAFGAGSLRNALRQRPRLYAGLAACWLLLVPLVASGPRSHSAGLQSGITPWAYLLNEPAIVLRYLRLTVWPVGLVLDYGPARTVPWRDALPAAAPLVLLAAATALAWRTHRRLAFLGTWFFLTLAPTSSIVPIASEVGAERRMYLPLAALVVFAGVACDRLAAGRRRTLTAGVAVVAATLAALTVARNAEYRDPPGLWQTVIDRRPHGRAHYNRGIMLKAAGRRDEAVREFEQAALDLPDAEYALGFELAADGRHLEAVQHLRLYAKARPDDVNVIRAYNLIGQSLVELRQFDEAVDAFLQVLRMQPRNLDALAGLADSRLEQGRLEDAVAAYREYDRLAPGNVKVYANLGISLGRLGRHEDAIASLTAAVGLDPNDPGLRMNLAASLAATGQFDAAVEQCRRAIEREPDPAARTEIDALIAKLAAWKRATNR